MKQKYAPAIIALSLIVIAVTLRILPHPANFAPVGAIAIFGGSILPKRMSVFVPLLAMMISDAVIGFYSLMPLIWACYLVIALASSHWLRPARLFRGIGLTLGASTFFFVVTNFGVWATSGMYAHTWSGLMSCYALAVPFFRNTLLSDAVYTALLFSIYAFAMHALKIQRQTTSAKLAKAH